MREKRQKLIDLNFWLFEAGILINYYFNKFNLFKKNLITKLRGVVMKKMIKKILIIIGVVVLLSGWGLYLVGNDMFVLNKLSTEIVKSKKTYDKYRNMDYLSMYLKFLMADSRDPKIIFKVLNNMGANVKCESMNMFIKQIEAYQELKLISVITSKKVQRGDIIILRPTWRGQVKNQRVGIILNVDSSYIKFVEYDDGVVFSKVPVESITIQSLVEFSYPLWAGVALHNGMRVTRGLSLYHNGYDIKMINLNKEVFAFTEGKVVVVYDKYKESLRYEEYNNGGNYIKVEFIRNNIKYYLTYCHLLNIRVKKGDVITKDTLLGNYADIGNSFGAHLHISLYNFKHQRLDPLPILQENASYILYGQDIKEYYVRLFCSNEYFKS